MHFAAGPWFTVQPSGSDFREFGRAWLSDGSQDVPARVELRVRLDEPEPELTWTVESEQASLR